MERLSNKFLFFVLTSILLLTFALPLLSGAYTNYIIIKISILSLYAVAFNIMFGYCGLLSFGHAIFFSASAYTLGVSLTKLNLPIFVALLAGLLTSVIFSIIVGFLSLRHKEIHFAMITLALSMLFWGVVMKWRSVTGGEDGITGISRSISMIAYYYICIITVLSCLFIIYKIIFSDFGLLLEGIRENEIRVEFSAHSVVKLRMLAMIISGLFTGIAGILWAFLDGAVTPTIAHWSFSAVPVIAALIGGPQSFVGPIIGTIVYVIAEDFITRFTLYWQIWLGIVVVLIVLFFRGGIVGTIAKVVSEFYHSKLREKYREREN